MKRKPSSYIKPLLHLCISAENHKALLVFEVVCPMKKLTTKMKYWKGTSRKVFRIKGRHVISSSVNQCT